MYDNRDDIYWMWLKSIEGIGAARFNRLLVTHNSPKQVYIAVKQSPNSLSFLSPEIINEMRKKANRMVLESMLDALDKHHIRILTRDNPDFPILLSQVHNPPPVIFVRGKKVDLNAIFCVAIIGTRHCTSYGKGIAQSFAKSLAQNRVTVVSGLALGIDAEAHYGALESGYEQATIAVLANGLDRAYPAANRVLFEKILQRGCAISENVPGTVPTPSSFPIRNRIMAGLSRGVLVVEGRKRSGTRFTVDFALDAGRDVFAIPGRISDAASEYPMEIIKTGAKLITSPLEILQEYDIVNTQIQPVQKAPKAKRETWESFNSPYNELSNQERIIVDILMKGECSADELFEQTLIPMNRLLATITGLMQKQVITKSLTGIFSINN